MSCWSWCRYVGSEYWKTKCTPASLSKRCSRTELSPSTSHKLLTFSDFSAFSFSLWSSCSSRAFSFCNCLIAVADELGVPRSDCCFCGDGDGADGGGGDAEG